MAFSTTITLPDHFLDESEHDVIPDICNVKGGGDENIMTDGCGLISRSLMELIQRRFELTKMPCAIQGRFGSCKGVWVVAEDKYMRGKKLLSRKSQEKFLFKGKIAQEHRTLEILSVNRAYEACLHNAATNFLLVLGLSDRHLLELAEEEKQRIQEMLEATPEKILQTLKPRLDKISTQLRRLLLAGFEPSQCGIYRFWANVHAKMKFESIIEGKIPVREGANLLMIPDHTGTLKPNEVFVQFSGHGSFQRTIIEGDVVVFRAPVQLLSDIQILKACYYPELQEYHDCIVFSTQGTISPGSVLSGGDYDGDLAWVLWDQRIVRDIKPIDKGNPPETLKKFAQKDPIGSKKLCEFNGESIIQQSLLDYSVVQASHSYLGILTTQLLKILQHVYWDNQASHSSPTDLARTIAMDHDFSLVGYLCCEAVDAAKAGIRIVEKNVTRHNYKNERILPVFEKLKQSFQRSEKKQPIDEVDPDLLLREDQLDEDLINRAFAFVSRLKKLRTGSLFAQQKEPLLYELYKEYEDPERRVAFAAACYTLNEKECKPVRDWVLFSIFLDEFCRLKADAVALRLQQTLSYSILQ